MVGKFVEYKTAREIWAALNRIYQSPLLATVLGLNSQLERIKKEGISIFEYIARIKDVFDKYTPMGEPLSYRDKIMYTLNGLTEEYDGFVTSIYNRSDKPSLEVHSLLYTYEYLLEQRNTAQQLQFPQVNLTTYHSQTNFTKIITQILLDTHQVHIQLSQTRPPTNISPFTQALHLVFLGNHKGNLNHHSDGLRNKELEILGQSHNVKFVANLGT